MNAGPLQSDREGDLLVGMTNKPIDQTFIPELTACGVVCRLNHRDGRKTVWRSHETRCRTASGVAEPGITVRIERWKGVESEHWTVTRSVSFRERDGFAPTGLRRLYAQLVGEGRSLEEAEEQCVLAEEWLGDAGSDDG